MEFLLKNKISLAFVFLYSSVLTAVSPAETFDGITQCDIFVSEPWGNYTYVPQKSTVHLNCTGNSTGLYWSIIINVNEKLQQNDLRFDNNDSINILNNNSFYDESPSNSNIIQLRIETSRFHVNDSQSLIRCVDGRVEDPTIPETTLIVYEPREIACYYNSSEELDIQSAAEVSWALLECPMLDSNTLFYNYDYLMVVTNRRGVLLSAQLNNSFFNFTAPDNAPPCEVYNFSVTATPVGATYTGDGCSVHGPVLSRMLPSLPDIEILQLSLDYTLAKHSQGYVNIDLHFMKANFCKKYPVHNYSLMVLNDSIYQELQTEWTSTSPHLSGNLTENSKYLFKVRATNFVGKAETSPRRIFTTDVQRITVATMKEMKSPDKSSVIVACNFITNSNAKGCMIHFIDDYNRTIMEVNLTRNATTNRACVLIESSENISELYGYDLEYDGSVGSLKVPGIAVENVSSNSSLFLNFDCKLLNNTLSPPSSYRTLIVSLATLATISALAVLSVILLLGAIKNKNKRKKLNRSERSENNYEQEEKENEYYVLEEVESGEVQAATESDTNNENEHHYHVLESNEHRATEIENFYHILEENEASSSSVLPPSNTKPVYFEVLDLPTTQTSEPEESSLSHFTEEHNSPSPKVPTAHVYHDICDLPQEDTVPL